MGVFDKQLSSLRLIFNVNYSSTSEEFGNMQKKMLGRIASGNRLHLSEAEDLTMTSGRDLLKKFLQETINGFGLGDVGPILYTKDGASLRCKRIRKNNVMTLFGKITIERIGYYQKGGACRFPLDAFFNLPKVLYSHKLRKYVAVEASKGSFGEAAKAIYENFSIKIHKRQIEEIAISASQDYDEFYAQKLDEESKRQAKQLPILALSLDSKGIVMRKQDLTEPTRKALEQNEQTLKSRLTPGEKLNRKRMATAAAVYNIDFFKRSPSDIVNELDGNKDDVYKKRPKPACKRVWARIDISAEQVTDDVFFEAKKRDPDLQKKWVILVDGDPNQIKRIKNRIKKMNSGATIILDIIHLIEYLWRAARNLFKNNHKDCENWVKRKLLEILQGSAGYAAAGIKRTATNRKLEKNDRHEIDRAANYILKLKEFMKYDQYLSAGQ